MSVSMNIAAAVVNLGAKKFRTTQGNAEEFRRSLQKPTKAAQPPRWLHKHGRLTHTTVQGFTVWRYEPNRSRAGVEMMYIPGGGYVAPLTLAHWLIVQRLAERTGASITVPLYPLAPKYTSDTTNHMLDATWRTIAEGAGTRHKFVAGDSAGGHASLSLALRHMDDDALAADGVIAISPWLDLMLHNPKARQREPQDLMLRIDGLRVAAQLWAGEHDASAPPLNLMQTKLEGLPPTLIAQGARDLFYDDAAEFTGRLKSAGVFTRTLFEPDGFHVYPGAIWTPEAKRFFRSSGQLVSTVIDRRAN